MKKSTNHKKRPIGIVIVAAIMLLLLTGMILAPRQVSALSKFNTNTDTSNLKHGIRDGVSVNLQHRDQHMNQENLCYRDNTCRQSNTGQNTLGNDNSVTGFADQSDNLQQSAAAPTTANQTTPTPTPAPTTATLTVIKIVSGNATNTTPSNFTMHVTGNNPTPANFAGSNGTGTDVTLGPGTFSVTETGPTSSFNTTTTGDCSGTITAGQHLSCTITNTPKTCVECFTTVLSSAQQSTILSRESFAELCTDLETFGISENQFRLTLLEIPGFDTTTVDELIACLKVAGIVFNP
jgi:Prealbumin-like fold domain